MGANVSTDVKSQSTLYDTQTYAKCGSTSSVQKLELNNVKIITPAACPDSKINIQQGVVLDSECYIDTVVRQSAELAQNLSEDVKTGLGINVNTDVNDTVIDINNLIDLECKDVVNVQEQTYNQVELNACDIFIAQTNDTKSKCRLGAAQELANKIDTETKKVEEGGSLLGFLGIGSVGSTIILSIIGIIVLIAVIVIVYKMVQSSGKKKQMAAIQPESAYNFGAETDPFAEGSGGLNTFVGGMFRKIIGGSNDENSDRHSDPVIIMIIVVMFILIMVFVIISWNYYESVKNDTRIATQASNLYFDAVKNGCKPISTNCCVYPELMDVKINPSGNITSITPSSNRINKSTPSITTVPPTQPTSSTPSNTVAAYAPEKQLEPVPAADYSHHFFSPEQSKKLYEGFGDLRYQPPIIEPSLDDFYRVW